MDQITLNGLSTSIYNTKGDYINFGVASGDKVTRSLEACKAYITDHYAAFIFAGKPLSTIELVISIPPQHNPSKINDTIEFINQIEKDLKIDPSYPTATQYPNVFVIKSSVKWLISPPRFWNADIIVENRPGARTRQALQ